jgi:hypothetical protein
VCVWVCAASGCSAVRESAAELARSSFDVKYQVSHSLIFKNQSETVSVWQRQRLLKDPLEVVTK